MLVVMAVGDHPGLLRRYRQQRIVLDAAYPDEVLPRFEVARGGVSTRHPEGA